jgi:hypothetical protein
MWYVKNVLLEVLEKGFEGFRDAGLVCDERSRKQEYQGLSVLTAACSHKISC